MLQRSESEVSTLRAHLGAERDFRDYVEFEACSAA
jgi:hypothetical protein